MEDTRNQSISIDEQNEIKEIVSLFVSLPKEDRAILLANANAFRTRLDIEQAKNSK